MEEGIRIRIFITSLDPGPTRLDEGVEPFRLDPLVAVGVLVRYGRLDGLWKVTDRLGERHGLSLRVPLSIPLGQFGVGTSINASEHDSGFWVFHLGHLELGILVDGRLRRRAPCAPLPGAKNNTYVNQRQTWQSANRWLTRNSSCEDMVGIRCYKLVDR